MTAPRPCALLTRPRTDSESVAELLAERDIASLIEPLIEIAPDGAAALDLAGAQAILLTSANGARVLAARLGPGDPAFALPVLAVGDSTMRAARQTGFGDVTSAEGDADSLLALTTRTLRPDAGRLVHIAGRAVTGDLVGRLRARGYDATRTALYDAVAATALSANATGALRAQTVDFALFFSPRTAGLFVKLARDAGLAQAIREVRAVCLSDAVARRVADLHWREVATAAEPTLPAIIEATVRLTPDSGRR